MPLMPMTEPTDSPENPQPARVRAARGYANLTQAELGERLKVSAQFVKRVENGKRLLTQDELIDIAEACEVPTWFMFNGWEGPTRDLASLWERVERLEREFEPRVLRIVSAARGTVSPGA